MIAESRLCDLFGYRRCVLFGRARSGIVAVLRALGAKTLVGPANCCPAVVYAAVAAGADYRMVPPNPTGNVADPVPMMAVAGIAGPTVWMPTHLYGEHAIFDVGNAGFVLENDTLAVTASRNPKKQPIGDALLVSLGHGKTISAGGGGAVLTDDAGLATEMGRIAGSWGVLTGADLRRDLDFAASRRHDSALAEAQWQSIEACERRLSASWRGDIHAALNARIPKIERAGQRWEWWYEALRPRDLRAHGCIVLNPDVPWRLTMLLDAPKRDTCVAALRAEGFDAGTNYPNLARSFPNLLGGQCHQHADDHAARVMQLWLTDDYDQARIQRGAEIIRRTISENLG